MMLENTFFATLEKGDNKYLRYPCRVLVTNGEYHEDQLSWIVVRVLIDDFQLTASVMVKNPKFSDRKSISSTALKLVIAANDAVSDHGTVMGEALSGTYHLSKEDAESIKIMLEEKEKRLAHKEN